MDTYNIIKLNTARNALRYVIKAFDICELFVPYYICPAVRAAINKENCKINFYHIDINFKPACDFPYDAFILYPNYFGVCTSIVKELSFKYKNLIVDNAHAFFSAPVGIASFNSIRKFFPYLRDGAFLYTKQTAYVDLKKDIYQYDCKELTYEELCRNENRLDNEDIKIMSDCSEKYLLNINMTEEKHKLIQHFKKYQQLYEDKNMLKYTLQEDNIPYKYPFLADNIENADKLVLELKKENIDIFRYWNNFPDNYIEKAFYTRLIAV